ncbi:hypothetical protein D3C86_1665950 [compost metagenome]
MVELLVLGYLQAFLTRFEIGARVSHVLVKPELVELVGKIVVVGNSLGVGRLVMDLAQRKVAFVITHQRHAQLITNPHNFFDRAFQLKPSFDKGTAQKTEAGMGKVGNQLGILHHDSYAWRWPEV